LTIEPLEVEKWLREVKKAEGLENPTVDKFRRVMNLVYKHGQRYGLIPRDESANPMNWVRQKMFLQTRRQLCEYRRFSV
jgi:heterodisulfide reductase subunit C